MARVIYLANYWNPVQCKDTVMLYITKPNFGKVIMIYMYALKHGIH